MKETLITTLLALAIPALIGLAFTGILALLGSWTKANAAAKSSEFITASMKLEAGVEAAVHAFQGDVTPLASQLAGKTLSPAAFGSQVLASLKKEGQTYVVPAVADALGTTLAGLEAHVLALAAKKVGLSTTAAPLVASSPK